MFRHCCILCRKENIFQQQNQIYIDNRKNKQTKTFPQKQIKNKLHKEDYLQALLRYSSDRFGPRKHVKLFFYWKLKKISNMKWEQVWIKPFCPVMCLFIVHRTKKSTFKFQVYKNNFRTCMCKRCVVILFMFSYAYYTTVKEFIINIFMMHSLHKSWANFIS